VWAKARVDNFPSQVKIFRDEKYGVRAASQQHESKAANSAALRRRDQNCTDILGQFVQLSRDRSS
jgi:hypothetical protein